MKHKLFPQINGKYCVACGVCQKLCPKKAITVPDGIMAIVDRTLCVGCGLCAQECPASSIKLVAANE